MYAGVGLGLGTILGDNAINFSELSPTRRILTQTANTIDSGKTGFAGQLFLGYGKEFDNKLYLGAEIQYLYNSISPSFTDFQIFTVTASGAISQDYLKTSSSIKNQFGLLAHLGYSFLPKLMLYFTAGAQYAKPKVQLFSIDSSDQTDSFIVSGSRWGYVLGVGGMVPVSDHFLIGADFQYAGYCRLNSTNFPALSTTSFWAVDSLKNKTSFMIGTIRLSYKMDF